MNNIFDSVGLMSFYWSPLLYFPLEHKINNMFKHEGSHQNLQHIWPFFKTLSTISLSTLELCLNYFTQLGKCETDAFLVLWLFLFNTVLVFISLHSVLSATHLYIALYFSCSMIDLFTWMSDHIQWLSPHFLA